MSSDESSLSGYEGKSPGIQTALRQIRKVARTSHTVLLTGESGTGKSRFARMIHQLSPRSAAPFVSVSCANLPKDLLESELFGHERGAFSGALQQKRGRVEMARGGTLFLDEIGELSLELQPKLLTFLQDRTFFRVGGHEVLTADVRVMAATHRNLRQMMEKGLFREDLFYRLNVCPVRIPPLRERVDEIPVLALGFLNHSAQHMGGSSGLRLEPAALDLLLNYNWPGNIRELENAMLRASTLVDDGGSVGPELIVEPPATGDSPQSEPVTSHEIVPLRVMERKAIAAALEACGGNRAEAAHQLGIGEKTIYNKIRKYGLGTRRRSRKGATT